MAETMWLLNLQGGNIELSSFQVLQVLVRAQKHYKSSREELSQHFV